jgi:DNA-directed RNA polymerase specialized sigma subunit
MLSDAIADYYRASRSLLMPNSLREEWSRHKRNTDELRNRALERLYNRKAVVDELIRSLENYDRFPMHKGPAQCVPITIRKYS